MSRRGDGGNYPRIIGEGCARGCQAVRGASGWCSRTFARVLAYQGQVPVRPALAYSRAEIHPVPTGNVGPKKNPPFGGFVVLSGSPAIGDGEHDHCDDHKKSDIAQQRDHKNTLQ